MILFLFACGPKLPAELESNATIMLPNCNQNDYLYARGFGSNPTESVGNARKNISEQITAKITTKTDLLTEYISKARVINGKVEDQSYEQKAFNSNIQTRSSFEHIELMKTIIEPVKSKDNYISLVCLNKAETNKVISNKLAPKADKFNRLTQQALKNQAAGNTAGFSIKYHQALELRPVISSELYIIRSATNTRSSLEAPFRENWDKLDEAAETIRNDSMIGLQLKKDLTFFERKDQTTKTFTQSHIFTNAFRKSLENNALQVQVTSKCQANLTHFISLEVEADCPSYTMTGYAECTVLYKASLQDCRSKAKTEITIANKKLKGMHQRRSDEALRKAAKSKHLETFVRKELRNYFPIVPLTE